MSPDSPPAPYGLGWTRRMAEMSAPPNATLREKFDRQLAVGIMTATTALYLVGSVLSLPWLPLAEVVGGAIPGLVGLIALLAMLGLGGPLWPYMSVMLFTSLPLTMVGPLAYPEGAAWANMAWVVVYPTTAALVTGVRGGVVWTGIVLASIAAVAAIAGADVVPPEWSRDEPMFHDPWILGSGISLVVCYQTLALTWFIQQRQIVEAMLEREQQASAELLHNALPQSVADRLKAGEAQIADRHYEVSVLFADIVGFTPMSAELSPSESLKLLDDVFTAFDEICARYRVEKIRTIGDGYMAVAGAPIRDDEHAFHIARAALEMRDWLATRGLPLQVRIGINSGPAVGGVVGRTRFHYDLWGDAVNIAARMESHGEPGRIQIGPRTRTLLGKAFRCTPRGEIDVKGRGTMETFWLETAVDC